MKKPLALPLLYPGRAHQLPGKGRLVPRGPAPHSAAEAVLDTPASNHSACKASGWGLNQATPAVQKIIVPTTKRCWEDESVNVHAMLSNREAFEIGIWFFAFLSSLFPPMLCKECGSVVCRYQGLMASCSLGELRSPLMASLQGSVFNWYSLYGICSCT